jgi:hypothetical protein
MHKPQANINFCDEGEVINLPLLKLTVSTWATSTNKREWLIAVKLLTEHGTVYRNYFSAVGATNTDQLQT